MAKEEAEKLTKVQKELNHLDSLVNADVAIIRDRIEAASIDFMQAQYVHTLHFMMLWAPPVYRWKL